MSDIVIGSWLSGDSEMGFYGLDWTPDGPAVQRKFIVGRLLWVLASVSLLKRGLRILQGTGSNAKQFAYSKMF